MERGANGADPRVAPPGMARSARSPGRSRLILTAALVALVAGSVALLLAGGGDPVPGPARRSEPQSSLPLAGAAASADRSDRAGVATERGCWTAPVGSSFRHRLVDRVDVAVHSPEAGTQSGGAMHAQCDVVTVVLDRRDGEILVRQQIEALAFLGADRRVIQGDAMQELFAAATVQPTFVRLDAAGRILGFAFPSDLDGDQRNFLRGTLGVFAFEAPAPGASAWTTRVADTTGEFEARYELLPAADGDDLALRRTRLRYTAIAGHDELPAHEVRGASEAHFALPLGWLRSVRGEEQLSLSLSLLDLRAATTRTTSLDLLAATLVDVGGDCAALWAAATAPASGRGESVGGHAARSEERMWRQRLEGVTAEQLLAELQRLLAVEPVDAEALDAVFQQLQWLLKLDDRVAAMLADRLGTGQCAGDEARAVLGALGAAATPAAQATLAAVRGNGSLGDDVRTAATVACLQLPQPSPAIVAGLLDEARGDSSLRGSSLLVFGALAPRAGEALADGRSPLQALLAMEDEAAARGELDTWLLALGNAGAPQILAIAQRLLGHVDAAVRGACCVALRGVAGDAALEALLQRGLGDRDPMVRQEAVLALSHRSEPAARAAIERTAQQDPDEGVRNRAARVLAQG